MNARNIPPVQHSSSSSLATRIAALKRLFPEAVSEDSLDFDALADLLGKAQDRRETYSFTWWGKQEALRSLSQPSPATLKPVPEESLHWDDTEQLFIEGENLEVLKLLQKSYAGRVKMIYIDPPYNTGNDYVYPDNFAEPLDNYLRETGQTDRDGNYQSSQPEKSGRRHSNWLSMMYPRLALARQLLRDDGVIFVSIDDNELHHLRLLLDMVFGAENFVATFPRRKRSSKNDVPNGVSQDYEWVICFAKGEQFIAGLPFSRKYYSSPDYPGDRWRLTQLSKQTTAAERPNSAFDLVDPKTGKVYPYNPDSTWRITRDTFGSYYSKGKIVFPGDYDFLNHSKPMFRVFESEDIAKARLKHGTDRSMKVMSTRALIDAGNNAAGTLELAGLFGEKVFSFPKPSHFIQEMIRYTTQPNPTQEHMFSWRYCP